MIIICCVDEKNGMSFYGKRITMDRIMREDLRALFPALSMDAYAYAMFAQDDADYIYEVCEDFTACSYPLFLETTPPSLYLDQIEQVVLYQWHRRYVSDVKMDIDLHDPMWELQDLKVLEGSSHEKITRAIYQRKGIVL